MQMLNPSDARYQERQKQRQEQRRRLRQQTHQNASTNKNYQDQQLNQSNQTYEPVYQSNQQNYQQVPYQQMPDQQSYQPNYPQSQPNDVSQYDGQQPGYYPQDSHSQNEQFQQYDQPQHFQQFQQYNQQINDSPRYDSDQPGYISNPPQNEYIDSNNNDGGREPYRTRSHSQSQHGNGERSPSRSDSRPKPKNNPNAKSVHFQSDNDSTATNRPLPRRTVRLHNSGKSQHTRGDEDNNQNHTRSRPQQRPRPRPQRSNSRNSNAQEFIRSNRRRYREEDAPLAPPKDGFFADVFSSPGNLFKNIGLGLGAGFLYGCFQNLTSKRMIHYRLYPDPEFFYIDAIMSKYYHRMSNYREFNEEAYCRALENTDRLFAHECAIRRRGPRFGDKSLAKTWIRNVGTDLFHFRHSIIEEKARAKFNILSRAIINRLLQHLKNIVKRVNVIYPKTSFIRFKEKRNPAHYACTNFIMCEEGSDQHQQQLCEYCGQHYRYHPKIVRATPQEASHQEEETVDDGKNGGQDSDRTQSRESKESIEGQTQNGGEGERGHTKSQQGTSNPKNPKNPENVRSKSNDSDTATDTATDNDSADDSDG